MTLNHIRSCPYCNSSSLKDIVTRSASTFDKHANSLDIVLPEIKYKTCFSCSLSFRTPIHNSDFIQSLYKSSYRSSVDPEELFEKVMSVPQPESELDLKVGFLIKKCGISSTSSVCDIGSGCGAFLHKLTNRVGCTTLGIEPDLRFSAFTSQTLNIDTLPEYYSGQSLLDYDVVTILHVLEHITESWYLVPLLFSAMKPGAYLYVETPSDLDAEHLSSDHNRFSLPHLYLFSTLFMNSVFVSSGFSVLFCEYVKTHRSKYDLCVLLQKP